MLELKVSSKIYKSTLNLKRRITYIRGESGTGKTSLVYVLDRYLRNVSGIDVDCRLKIRIMSEVLPTEELNVIRDSLLIFDDELASEYNMYIFNELCIKNNLYVIIINRVDSLDVDTESKIEYSVSSILISRCNGIEHYFVPVDNNFFEDKWDADRVDVLLTEDKYGLNSMGSLLGVTCETSKGKDNIVNKLDELVNKGYRDILVCADWSSFGRNFSDFYGVCLDMDANIMVDFNYECFEYMILMSNMLNREFVFDEEEANTYKSWENYFEAKLEELTKNKFYKYLHGNELRDCYTKECKDSYCNRFIKDICDKFISGDKRKYLFSKTIFEYMGSLRK